VSANPYYSGPRSDHFDGERFFSPDGAPMDRGIGDLLRWRFAGRHAPWSKQLPAEPPDRPPARAAGLRIAHVGHASLLLQADGLNILLDPVWSERVSPFRFAGPKRHDPPGIAFADLPPIDVVLITHSHYDHLDLDTIARLWRAHRPRILAPLGNDAVIRRRHPAIEVTTRDWGEAVELGGRVAATLVPANHWSARSLGDRRMALWCGYVLETPAGRIYLAGDSGYGTGAVFRGIRERHGAPRLAVLPIGAYEPRWFMQPQHMNPAEAVQAMRDCGAETALGYHWGTFRLTDEAREEPPRQLDAALQAAGIAPERFRPLRPGMVWTA